MKVLIISLDDDIEFTHISYNSTMQAIKNNVELIITPNIEFFSTAYIDGRYGYKVIVRNETNSICLNNLLKTKRVRVAQNASKMLLNGVFEDLGIIVDNYADVIT